MKIICIGRNYSKHAEELGNEKTEEPIVFLKPDTAILPKKMPFIIPEFSDNVQYEAEIVVKINRVGKHIDKKFANKYYEEIGLGIDFTARDTQSELTKKGLPWEKAKAFDGSAVLGSFINKSNFDNINNIEFSLKKNNDVVQVGNTADMTHSIDDIISYVSKYFTLKIGDYIFTGTPAGVGKVNENDILKGYIYNEEMFNIKVK